MSTQYMTKTQNLLQLSLNCHPIHPGIHKDHSIGAQTQGCLRYSNGSHGISCNSMLAILDNPANIYVRSLKSLGKGGGVREFCSL